MVASKMTDNNKETEESDSDSVTFIGRYSLRSRKSLITPPVSTPQRTTKRKTTPITSTEPHPSRKKRGSSEESNDALIINTEPRPLRRKTRNSSEGSNNYETTPITPVVTRKRSKNNTQSMPCPSRPKRGVATVTTLEPIKELTYDEEQEKGEEEEIIKEKTVEEKEEKEEGEKSDTRPFVVDDETNNSSPVRVTVLGTSPTGSDMMSSLHHTSDNNNIQEASEDNSQGKELKRKLSLELVQLKKKARLNELEKFPEDELQTVLASLKQQQNKPSHTVVNSDKVSIRKRTKKRTPLTLNSVISKKGQKVKVYLEDSTYEQKSSIESAHQFLHSQLYESNKYKRGPGLYVVSRRRKVLSS